MTDHALDPMSLDANGEVASSTAPRTSTSQSLARTERAIPEDVARQYLEGLDLADLPTSNEIEFELLEATNRRIDSENNLRQAEADQRLSRRKPPLIRPRNSLTYRQVAMIVAHVHGARRLLSGDGADQVATDLDALVIYDRERGVYLRSRDALYAAMSLYSDAGEQFFKNALVALRACAPSVQLADGKHWAPVANGDYERATGELQPFSPDRVFLSRGDIDYVPDAPNPIIVSDADGSRWDVDSGLMEIANNSPETYRQLWEILAAVVQPNVRTNKAIALVNPKGNNGKGTFVALAKRLAGAVNTLSASIADLAKESTLPALNGKSLLVSDENNTDDFVKSAESLKALISRDPVLVNPKHEKPYNLTFVGNQIHCLNAMPRFADNSASMWRRWLFVPLLAHFEGAERKYVKDDYIHRKDVLEYVLRTALQTPFIGFTETDDSRALMAAIKAHNDPARQFWIDLKDRVAWDLLPMELLYELFKGWFATNKPSGRVVDKIKFIESIRAFIGEQGSEWKALNSEDRLKAANRMSAPEPLLDEYGVIDLKWRSVRATSQYRGPVIRDRAAVALATSGSTVTADSLSQQEKVEQLSKIVDEDHEVWRRRAVEDDGVEDLAHVDEHAAIRRTGTSCACQKATRAQRAYPEAVITRSQHLVAALHDAQRDASD